MVDVCRTTLELLSDLLHQSSSGMIESKSSFPPTQDKECITFSVLNLLSLQFSAARNEDAESLGLVPGSPLLRALKQRIVDLASTPGIVASVQHAAQATLQAGWVFLLPTAEERAIALCGEFGLDGFLVRRSVKGEFNVDFAESTKAYCIGRWQSDRSFIYRNVASNATYRTYKLS